MAVRTKVGQVWWQRALLALILIGLAYGFASWAIDAGSLLLYAICIVLVYFGARNLVSAVRMAISR